jgi:hypothetical protein
LLYADFDGGVRRIIAQPFFLKTKVDQRIRKHVPDFLLVTEEGLVIVDVKPSARLSNPKIRFTLDWTRKLVEGRGWRYEVWCEPPAMELGNLRFLAGFRNPACFDAAFLDEIRQRDLPGCTLGDALNADFGRPPALVRSAVFHLLWNQYLTVDVTKRLTRLSILTKGPRL